MNSDLPGTRVQSPNVVPALLAGLIAGLIFLLTSSPTISWIHESQDSGELSACAATLGIAHPTGYPLFTLLGWIIIQITGIDPARAMVLLSVVCGAIGTVLIAYASSILISLVPVNRPMGSWEVGWWGVLSAGFAAFHPIFWSQAVVCEVYSLSLLLQAVVWLLIIFYLKTHTESGGAFFRRIPIFAGLVVGLILSHHPGGAGILIPIAVVAIARKPLKPLTDFLKFLAGLLPGLALYLYLPIRSMQNPVLDWGNPENLTNLSRHISAWQYRGLMFGTPSEDLLNRMNTFPWENYWGAVGGLLILMGLILPFIDRNRKGKILRPLFAGILIFSLWVIIFALGYWVSDFEIFYYPLIIPTALAISISLAKIASWLGLRWKPLPILLAVAVASSLVMGVNHRWVDMDASEPMRASAAIYASRVLKSLPENSLVITFTDGNCFAAMYAVTCGIIDPGSGERIGPRHDVDVVVANWVKYDWFRENVRDRWGVSGRLRFISPSHERDQALRILVDQNLGHRPVIVDSFVLEILEDSSHQYETEPIEPLFRIIPEN